MSIFEPNPNLKIKWPESSRITTKNTSTQQLLIEKDINCDTSKLLPVLDKYNIDYKVYTNHDLVKGYDSSVSGYCLGNLRWVNTRPQVDTIPLDRFNCTEYYHLFGPYLFNQQYNMITWGEFKRIYGPQLSHTSFFVRPNSGMKLFTGQVFNKDTNLEDFKISPTTLVVVSPDRSRDIFKEIRFVVSNSGVIAGSYFPDHPPVDGAIYDKAVIHANYFAKMAQFADNNNLYVMDIIIDTDLSHHICEINSFNCAGWYGCNLEEIVKYIHVNFNK